MTKTKVAKAYGVVTEIDEKWHEYDKSVAECQLENYGCIYLDRFGEPIDDENVLEEMFLQEKYSGEHFVGEIVNHRGHECRVTRVWNVDDKNGISIVPTGDYGWEVDIYEEQL